MSKKLIIILVVGMLLAASGYVLWSKRADIEAVIREKITRFITKQFGGGAFGNVGAPEITTAPQSLGNIPEVNPIDKTNPFKDTRTNPFE